MSGAEVFAVLGAISSVIAIIQTSQEILDAAKDSHGLPKHLRETANTMQLIARALDEAGKVQSQSFNDYAHGTDLVQKKAIEETSRTIKPVMAACRQNATDLKRVLEKCCPKDPSPLKRYAAALGTGLSGRKSKVDALLKDTLTQLQVLQTHEIFRSATTLSEIRDSLRSLSGMQTASVTRDSDPATSSPSAVGNDSQSQNTANAQINISNGRKAHNDGTPGTYTFHNAAGSKVLNQAEVMTFNGSQSFSI